MEIPKIVYHGTFWPEGGVKAPDVLEVEIGYICTTESPKWAEYFAWSRRWRYKDKPGILSIYEICTGKLPEGVLLSCIPPEGIDPRFLEDETFRRQEENMTSERIKIKEWRFPFITLDAVVNLKEMHLSADPSLSLFGLRVLRPSE